MVTAGSVRYWLCREQATRKEWTPSRSASESLPPFLAASHLKLDFGAPSVSVCITTESRYPTTLTRERNELVENLSVFQIGTRL